MLFTGQLRACFTKPELRAHTKLGCILGFGVGYGGLRVPEKTCTIWSGAKDLSMQSVRLDTQYPPQGSGGKRFPGGQL